MPDCRCKKEKSGVIIFKEGKRHFARKYNGWITREEWLYGHRKCWECRAKE